MEIHNLLPANHNNHHHLVDNNKHSSHASYDALISFDAIESNIYPDLEHQEDDDYGVGYQSHLSPQSEEVVDEISVIANTMNSLIGVPLFAMPWGFSQAGMMGAIVILVVVATLCFDTARMLLISQKIYYNTTGEVKGYPEIASASLGPIWSTVVKIATIISCMGGSTGYLIFFGETVGQALNVKAATVIYCAVIPMVIISWAKTYRELALFTVLSVIGLVIAVVVIILDGSQQWDADIAGIPLVKYDTVLSFLGPATFLFTSHYVFLSMGAESLRMRPSHCSNAATTNTAKEEAASHQSPLVQPIGIAYVLCVILVILVGGTGFAMFRKVIFVQDPAGHILTGCEDHVCQNIILNLSPGIQRNLVGLTMSIVIIASYILLLAPAREHIENYILQLIKPSDSTCETLTQYTLRTLIVLSTVYIALQAPYFGSMVGSVGGLTDAFQCFVLPPLIYLSVEGKQVIGWYRKVYYYVVVMVGIGTILYTAWSTAMDIFFS